MAEWLAGNAASRGVGITNLIGHGVACRCNQCATSLMMAQQMEESAAIFNRVRQSFPSSPYPAPSHIDADLIVAKRVLDMSKNRDELLCKAADIQSRTIVAMAVTWLLIVAAFLVLAILTHEFFIVVVGVVTGILGMLSERRTQVRKRESVLAQADEVGKAIIAAKFSD